MSRFEYNDEKHLYTLDGVPMPSVTGILSSVAVDCADDKAKANGRTLWTPVNDLTWLSDDGGSNASFGTNLHTVAAYMLKGVECDYDEDMEPWVDGLKHFFKEHGDRFELIHTPSKLLVEAPMYHKTLKVGGTPDWFAMDKKTNKIGCIDWKSCVGYQKHWRYQTAGYTDIAKSYFGIESHWTACVRLLNNDFKLDMREKSDFTRDVSHWKSILNVYKLMRG